MKLVKGVTLISAALMLAACGSSDDDSGVNYPSTYEFSSKLEDGQSSVKITGQAARQILIGEMKNATGKVDIAGLESIYSGGSEILKGDDIYSDEASLYGTSVHISAPEGFTLVQSDYTKVYDGAGSKKLSDKIAGCDNNLSATQFIGWDMTGLLVDCGTGGTKNDNTTVDHHDAPHSLMLEWIDAAAVNKVDTVLGLDYQQLFQKFLLGSVAFSQTAEDYLKATKLATAKNTNAKDVDGPYTALEHSWDEGFGYFGASTDYLNIADATINGKTYRSDVNTDGKIDLLKGEYNFGLAQYASKHDVLTGTTDLSSDIMIAFFEGRQLIQDNIGTNPADSASFNTELAAISDRAVKGMEKIFAISVIKYINETIGDLGSYSVGTGDNTDKTLEDLAKHWSELKGFALGLQFSPISTFSEAELIELHSKIGQSPINELENVHNDKAAYIEALEAARTMVQEKFSFDAEAVKTWGT